MSPGYVKPLKVWSPIVIALTCMATAVTAQELALGTGGIKGIVRDSLGLGIAGVEITMPGSTLRAESDDKGEFLLIRVPAGPLSLRLRRLGFYPDTVELMVRAGRTIPLDVIIQRREVLLTPVVVYGRETLSGWKAGFYQRKQLGVGHFLTREEIEKRNPMFLTDMFRTIPGMHVIPNPQGTIRNRVRLRDGRCAPVIWLDGSPMGAGEVDLDAFSPLSIEALEVYSGSAMAPVQFRMNSFLRSGCGGTIIIWSREPPPPQRKRNAAVSAAAETAKLVDQRRVFTAAQVDVPARQDSARAIRPIYPDALFDAGIGGSVLAEFIVDSDGSVNLETFSVIVASHPSFTDAVQRALEQAIYIPAVRQGYPVQQVVQHEFKFVPDATARRKQE
jgi:hypothetical protein